MTKFIIEVAGEPRGKGRPRFTRQGHAFTPAATRSYESAIRYAAQEEMNGAPPLDGALGIVVTATFPIPQSWSARKRAAALAGALQHTTKPDCDNILKVVDALNEICWRDDRQINHATIIKKYGARPSLRIEIVDGLL